MNRPESRRPGEFLQLIGGVLIWAAVTLALLDGARWMSLVKIFTAAIGVRVIYAGRKMTCLAREHHDQAVKHQNKLIAIDQPRQNARWS